MEIRKFTDVVGAIATEDIVDGRCVLLTSAPSNSSPFGLHGDLPGVKLPTDANEADNARYVVDWAMDNRKPPIYYPYPSYNYIVRNQGFESGQSDPSGRNLPMTNQTVYLTSPTVQEGLTIPSGEKVLAYAGGVFTFPSGHFVYSANLETPGTKVGVESAAGANRGKPTYDVNGVFGVVEEFDSDEFSLTVRTLVP